MTNFDDFRNSLDDEADNELSLDDSGVPSGIVIDENRPSSRSNRRFLGMTAGERAFLSVMLFLNVLILGAGVLIVTGRIVF